MTERSLDASAAAPIVGPAAGAVAPAAALPAEIERRLARRLNRAEVVSFDVFDTAIVRAVAEPTDLFHLMAGSVESLIGAAAADFATARPQAEALRRTQTQQTRRSDEVTLAEICDALCGLMRLDPALAEPLARLEIDAEMAICRQNPFIHGLYRWCRNRGKRVAFISDTYLPETAIADLLHRAGYAAWDALLVSSAVGKTKAEGALHGEARRRLTARRWLHIGDNRQADVVTARRHGMATWHYRRCVEQLLHKSPPVSVRERQPVALAGSVSRGLVANRLAAARPAPRHAGDAAGFWRDFGYATAGPLLVGFTEWLVAQAAERRLEALYFLARDGLIMQRVYDALMPRSAGGVETHYLLGSRRALNVAAITAIDERALAFLTAGNGRLEAWHFLDRLGLDWRAHAGALRAAGFGDPQQKVGGEAGEAALRRLFTLLAEPVCERARGERAVVTDYLRGVGLRDGRRIGIVDIGWHGSIQRSIADILAADGGGPQITGLYLGTFGYHTPLFDSAYPHDAYLCRLGQPVEYSELVKTSVEVVELLFSAPEGSVIRIERAGTGFAAIRDTDSLDEGRNAAIRWLQDGAMAFVAEYAALRQHFPDLETPREAAVAPLRRVLLHPRRIEARHIGEIRHADAFGEVVKRPIAPAPRWRRLLGGRQAFRRELREAYWRPGRDARMSRLGRAIGRLVLG